jgi:hypothetical protein
MATVTKDFRVKNGIVVEGSTATVNGHDVLTEALVDAKGDLIVASGADAVTRLAAGTNGYVLTANSSATNGLEWAAAPAVGSFETSIVFEGTTANDFETTLQVIDPTADRTITFKDASGTVAFTSDIPTNTDGLSEGSTNLYFTNERAQDAIGNSVGTGLSYNDTTGAVSVDTTTIQARVADVSDTEIGYLNGVTSAIQTQLDAKASSSDLTTHGNLTEAHGATGAVVGTTNTQTLTNKTLTTPTINGPTITDTGQTPTIHGIYLPAPHTIIFEGTTANDFETTLTAGEPTGDRTVTLPDATGTVALTNNKLDAFAATTSAELRTVISDETGTGGLVFADTPTLITPNIGAATGTSLVLSGDLTVNGTTTTINSTEITVDDKNLTLGSVATPTDAGADGGGITLKGATDKTLNWIDATDSWTSSEHVNLASGKELKINGTSVLSGSTLGSGVTASSLTSVGTISSGTWNGTAIAVANGGTGATDNGTARTNLGLAIGSDVQAYNSTLAAVAGGTYSGDDSITTVGTITAGTWNGTTIAVANGGTGITSFGTGIADFLGTPSSANLAAAVTDETGTGALVFGTSPTLTTPNIGAATATSITLTDALIGTATQAITDGTATIVDSWAVATYSSAKYIVQMKNGNDIEVLEVLVTVDGNNNVYLTEYADIISNASIGTTDADFSGGNVRLKVTSSNGTAVKVHKTLIEA